MQTQYAPCVYASDTEPMETVVGDIHTLLCHPGRITTDLWADIAATFRHLADSADKAAVSLDPDFFRRKEREERQEREEQQRTIRSADG